jgi:TolA-binding protein
VALQSSNHEEGLAIIKHDDGALANRLVDQIHETESRIQMLSEEIAGWNKEKKILKAQEKTRFGRRSMQFGGVGALF